MVPIDATMKAMTMARKKMKAVVHSGCQDEEERLN
jgi:hypothetical protein